MNTKDELKNLCDNVVFLRQKNKLSKRFMAQKLHISIKTLTHIENGVIPKRLSVEFLFRIYDEFHISPKDMVSTLISTKNTQN